MGGIDLKVISATENSNKFQITRFWKEKSVEDVVTLGPMAQATLVIIIFRPFLMVDGPKFSHSEPGHTSAHHEG